MGVTYSPIHRDIGNIEYLLWLTIDPNSQARNPEDYLQLQQTTTEIVAEAHEVFEN